MTKDEIDAAMDKKRADKAEKAGRAPPAGPKKRSLQEEEEEGAGFEPVSDEEEKSVKKRK